MFLIAATILALISATNAHLFMNSPTPISGSAPKDPLDPSGSNFPCHGVSLGVSNGQSMEVGSTQTLSFELGGGANTAVHGGGSCQLSITYETDSEKIKDPSNWKVIHSIIDGCPSNTFGNLNVANPCTSPDQTDCVNAFDYQIPEGLMDGDATIAWTWFNNIGNREMYMNCAAVSITGGSDTLSSDFPDMFVANIQSVTSCTTEEGVNVQFPNPGAYVTEKSVSDESVSYPIAIPNGCGSTDSDSPSQYNPVASQDPVEPSVVPSVAPVAPSNTFEKYIPASSLDAVASVPPTAPTNAYSVPDGYHNQGNYRASLNPGGVFAPQPTSFATRVGSAPTQAPEVGNDGGISPDCVSCSEEGALVCVSSDTQGICANGCVVPQPVAPGTTCTNGAIEKRSLPEASRSRVYRRTHRHGRHIIF